MTNKITQTRSEVAIDHANTFLATERAATIDGGFAASQIATRVMTAAEHAEDLLTSVPHPKLDGLYIPLSSSNANRYDEVVAALPGHLVLVPSAMVDTKPSAFYPAVVSEDSLASGKIRLHILQQPYRQAVQYGASLVLSAAGQSETGGIGSHDRNKVVGVEAEHFSTLTAASADPGVKEEWKAGVHINHDWRKNPKGSVNAEVSARLFGQEIPQTTRTITKEQIVAKQAIIFWHAGMRDNDTGMPETATRANALVAMQALSYEQVSIRNPKALDTLKELIS